MKKKTKKFEGITIWVNNIKANEVFMTPGMLSDRFKMWLKTKEIDWLTYYWFEPTCRAFLTEKAPGCQGVFNESDFDGVYQYLKPIADAYLKKHGSKSI